MYDPRALCSGVCYRAANCQWRRAVCVRVCGKSARALTGANGRPEKEERDSAIECDRKTKIIPWAQQGGDDGRKLPFSVYAAVFTRPVA